MKARIKKSKRVYRVVMMPDDSGTVVVAVPHRRYDYDEQRAYLKDEYELIDDTLSRGGQRKRQ